MMTDGAPPTRAPRTPARDPGTRPGELRRARRDRHRDSHVMMTYNLQVQYIVLVTAFEVVQTIQLESWLH